MKIVSKRKIEDCADGSEIYAYEFDAPWSEPSIRSLAALGKLDYFTDFPRPMFHARSRSGLDMKGIEGETACRVRLPKAEKDAARREFEAFFKT